MTKASLRELYLNKRKAMSETEKLKADDLLLIKFQQLSFSDVDVLLSYYPMDNNNEPNTHIYTRYLQHMIPGLNVCYPVSNFSDHTMQAMLTHDETDFELKKNIWEPVNGEIIEPSSVDVVFVPFIICDTNGYRVGYGKGFYDRFLSRCREDVLKIGFSYFEPCEPISDTHEYDVPLNYCITPQNIYEF